MIIHDSLKQMLEAEGLMIVPKTPTPEMLQAAYEALCNFTQDDHEDPNMPWEAAEPPVVWRTMLAAAPQQ